MRRPVLAATLAFAAATASPASAAPILLGSAPATTYDLEARARNGRTGFELSLHSPTGQSPPSANLNATGTPAWTFGTWTDFAITYSAATGQLSLGADFSQSGGVQAGETTSFTFAGSAGSSYQFLNFNLAGNAISDMQVRNLSINGTPFAGPYSSSGTTATNLYFDLGIPSPGTITITGQLNLTANGNTDERPRLQVLFGGANDPNAAPVPEPATVGVFGLMAGGAAAAYRRRARRAGA